MHEFDTSHGSLEKDMSIIKKQRSRTSYEEKNTLLARGTQNGIKTALDNFEKFGLEKYNTDDLATELKLVEDEVLFDTMQEWINWSTVAPSTLALYFSRIKDYLYYRGVKISQQDVKHELKFPHKIEEEFYGITREEINTIFRYLSFKYRLIFTCQSSALMRIGETLQLRKKHLETENEEGIPLKNIIIHIPAPIAKFKKARTTFLSTEASKMLRPVLKKLDDDDLVFTTQENYVYAELSAGQALRRALVQSHLDMRYESTDYFKINTHSFRAFGITKMARIDENLSKKLSGQKGYLLQYDRLKDPEKLEIYKKCEVDLLIDNTQVQQAKITKLKEENNKLQIINTISPEDLRTLLKMAKTSHSDQ